MRDLRRREVQAYTFPQGSFGEPAYALVTKMCVDVARGSAVSLASEFGAFLCSPSEGMALCWQGVELGGVLLSQ